MGPMAQPAIPSLIRVLSADEEPTIRIKAAWALGSIGNGDSDVIAALTGTLLKDKDFGVRQTATNALLKLGSATAGRAH
jgi:HEAT repeat protein